MKRRPNLEAILCALVAMPAALGAPGDLDPTFGLHGRVIVDIANDDDLPAGAVLLPDGRILVGRANTNAADDFSVLRFMPDGSPDTSFDFDGRTSLDIPGTRGTTRSVIPLPDGRILAVGWARSTDLSMPRIGLLRYLADGSPDPSFGDGGLIRSELHYDGLSISAILQPDGRLVVAGHVNDSAANTRKVALARFEADGSPDRSFGRDGYVYSAGSTREWTAQLSRQVDGRLLLFMDVELTSARSWYDWRPVVLRFNTDGSPDAAFGTSGRVGLQETTAFSSAAIRDDNRILLATASSPFYWDIGYCGATLAQLHPDGGIDESFGTLGFRDVQLGGCQTFGAAILLLQDGKILFNGARGTSLPTAQYVDSVDPVVNRMNSAGDLDSTFGIDGRAVLDVGEGAYPPYGSNSGTLLRQEDGRLVMVTSGIRALVSQGENNRLVIARLLASGESPGLIGIKSVGGFTTESDGRVNLRIRRSGGSAGIVSADYSIWRGNTPGGNALSAGTVTWADGDRADKTIVVGEGSGATNSVRNEYTVNLANTTGGAGLAASSILVTIEGVVSAPPPATTVSDTRSGGAMSGDFLLMLALAFLLRTWRSRRAA